MPKKIAADITDACRRGLESRRTMASLAREHHVSIAFLKHLKASVSATASVPTSQPVASSTDPTTAIEMPDDIPVEMPDDSQWAIDAAFTKRPDAQPVSVPARAVAPDASLPEVHAVETVQEPAPAQPDGDTLVVDMDAAPDSFIPHRVVQPVQPGEDAPVADDVAPPMDPVLTADVLPPSLPLNEIPLSKLFDASPAMDDTERLERKQLFNRIRVYCAEFGDENSPLAVRLIGNTRAEQTKWLKALNHLETPLLREQLEEVKQIVSAPRHNRSMEWMFTGAMHTVERVGGVIGLHLDGLAASLSDDDDVKQTLKEIKCEYFSALEPIMAPLPRLMMKVVLSGYVLHTVNSAKLKVAQGMQTTTVPSELQQQFADL